MPKNFFAALDSDEEERTTAPAPAKKAAKPAAAAAPRARGAGGARGGANRAVADYQASRDTRGSERRQCVTRPPALAYCATCRACAGRNALRAVWKPRGVGAGVHIVVWSRCESAMRSAMCFVAHVSLTHLCLRICPTAVAAGRTRRAAARTRRAVAANSTAM